MKKTLWSLALLSLVLSSCSDDSDKIDEYYRLKKERLMSISPNEMPTVSKVYCDAIVFSPGINDYYTSLIIDEDKEKVKNVNIDYSNSWNFLWSDGGYDKEEKVLQDLEPNTTYFYKVAIRRGYRYFEKDSYGEDVTVYSPVQSVTTKKYEIPGYKPKITSISWYSTYSGVTIDFSRDRGKENAANGEFYSGKVNYPIEIYYSTTNDVAKTESNLLFRTMLLEKQNYNSNWLGGGDDYFYFSGRNNKIYSGTTYYFRVVVNGVSSDVKSFKR